MAAVASTDRVAGAAESVLRRFGRARPTGYRQWRMGRGRSPAVARAAVDWLTVERAVAARAAPRRAWDRLALNSDLVAGLRLCGAPRLLLRAEIPLRRVGRDDAGEASAAWLEAMGAAIAGSPLKIAASGALGDRLAADSRTLAARGWPVSARPGGGFVVDLEARYGPARATLSATPAGTRLWLALCEDGAQIPAVQRDAAAEFCLRAATALRLVRPAVTGAGGLGLEIVLPPGLENDGPIALAVAALSRAAEDCGTEVAALLGDPDLSRVYLETVHVPQ